jgi:cytidine deaminase
MCRQFLREFCAKEMKVYMYGREKEVGGEGKTEIRTLGALLPMSFGPEELKDGQVKDGGGEARKKVPGMD